MGVRNLKETWRKFTEAVKNKSKTAVIAATSAFLLNSMTSCSSADKYQSWEVQLEIKQEKARMKVEIWAYNKYFKIYENFQKDLVELQAKGDIWGYQNVYKKAEQLAETIKNLEEDIDDRADNILDLEKELNEGKADFSAEQIKNQRVPTSWTLQKRSFDEYRTFIQ